MENEKEDHKQRLTQVVGCPFLSRGGVGAPRTKIDIPSNTGLVLETLEVVVDESLGHPGLVGS